MDDPTDPPPASTALPPSLPDVASPPPEDVLDSVPSTQDVIAKAQTADEIVAGQPSVEDLLGPNR